MEDAANLLCLGAIDLLRTAAGERASPDSVQRRARQLSSALEGAKVDVFWEIEPYSKEYHYDLLVRAPGGPAIVVSAGPDRGIPWIYRGSYRWNETVLFRVNNQRVLMRDAIVRCDALWGTSSIAERLINGAIVADYIEREGLEHFEIKDEELQQTVDAIRHRHGLFTEEATRAWMETRGMTTEGLVQLARETGIALRVRQRVVGGREEEYFVEHRDEFERAVVLEVVARGDAEAEWFYGQACERPDGLMIAVHRRAVESLASGKDQTVPQSSYRTLWRRPREATVERVFQSNAGDVLPPCLLGSDRLIVQILARKPPVWDEATRQEAGERMFKSWLSHQRRAARIEWSWERTPQASV